MSLSSWRWVGTRMRNISYQRADIMPVPENFIIYKIFNLLFGLFMIPTLYWWLATIYVLFFGFENFFSSDDPQMMILLLILFPLSFIIIFIISTPSVTFWVFWLSIIPILYWSGITALIFSDHHFLDSGVKLIIAWTIFTFIVSTPSVIFWALRSKFASKFETKQYISKKRHQKAIMRIMDNEEKARYHLSNQSEKRNIDPLISATRQELHNRKEHVTPNITKRTETILRKFQEENNVPEINELYEVIINTRPESLNLKISEYLKKKEA